jgi:hypothetical protein
MLIGVGGPPNSTYRGARHRVFHRTATWIHAAFRVLCSAKNLILLNFRPPFMPLPSRVGIRDANRPERRVLPLGDYREYGGLNFVAPECLLRVPERLVPGWREGALGCSE